MNDPVAHRPEQSPLKGSVVGSTPTGISKLIKALQWAHSSELGAYHAYLGHLESLSDPYDGQIIHNILYDELKHIITLRTYLKELNAETNTLRDKVFIVIGKTLGFLCKVTGYRLPMFIASLMERVGKNGYDELADQALKLNMHELASDLSLMARVEEQHENTLRDLLDVV